MMDSTPRQHGARFTLASAGIRIVLCPASPLQLLRRTQGSTPQRTGLEASCFRTDA